MSATTGRMMRNRRRQGKEPFICCSKHFRRINDPFSRQIEMRHALSFEGQADNLHPTLCPCDDCMLFDAADGTDGYAGGDDERSRDILIANSLDGQ